MQYVYGAIANPYRIKSNQTAPYTSPSLVNAFKSNANIRRGQTTAGSKYLIISHRYVDSQYAVIETPLTNC